jgi:hypothetical protein
MNSLCISYLLFVIHFAIFNYYYMSQLFTCGILMRADNHPVGNPKRKV